MDERVWEKTAQFLKELRCEDTRKTFTVTITRVSKGYERKIFISADL